VTRSKFYTEGQEVLGAIIKRLVTMVATFSGETFPLYSTINRIYINCTV